MRLQSPSSSFVSFRASLASLAALAVLPALSVGCGSSDSAASPAATTDAGASTRPVGPLAGNDASAADGGAEAAASPSPFGNGAPSSVYPAPHPDAPIVVNEAAGEVMKAMKVIPVFFPNDQYQTQLTDFLKTLGATDYWKAVTEEYGVGVATSGTPVVLTQAPPTTLTDNDIQAFVQAHAGTDAAWGTPDANTLYVLFYPSATTISLSGEKSCQTFGGYHSNTKLNGNNLAYAVIPRCRGFGGQGIAGVTGPTSHELVEAATDPFPQDNPAYTSVANAQIAWAASLGGSEVSDLCAQSRGAFFTPAAYTYSVQRSWSNKAAAASHDPCVPALAGPYFNSAVVLPDDVPVQPGAPSKTVDIAVGKSKTVEIDLFSDAPTDGPWTVKAVDVDGLETGTDSLEFSFDRTSGVNGEKLNLTITVVAKGTYGLERFLLVSTLGNQQTLWAGMVTN